VADRRSDRALLISEAASELSGLAEAVRQACVDAAVRSAEDAGIRGLCAEGRLEAAIDAIRELSVEDLISGR
jgi:hypothetical protein